MNQEEADQDVADEVSEEVDSRGEVMCSKKTTVIGLRPDKILRLKSKLSYYLSRTL